MKASHAVLWGSMLVLERVRFGCQASAFARACRGRMREESVNSQPEAKIFPAHKKKMRKVPEIKPTLKVQAFNLHTVLGNLCYHYYNPKPKFSVAGYLDTSNKQATLDL